jgi:hypothetical protein
VIGLWSFAVIELVIAAVLFVLLIRIVRFMH